MSRLRAATFAGACFAGVLLDGASTGEAISEPPLPTICVNEFISVTTVPTFNSPTPPCIGIPADINQQLDRSRERNGSRTNWNWLRFAVKPAIFVVVAAVVGIGKLAKRRRSSTSPTPWVSSTTPPLQPGPPPPPPFGQSPLRLPPPPPPFAQPPAAPPPSTSDVLSSWGIDNEPPKGPPPTRS